MKLKILAWNVGGLNTKEIRELVRNKIQSVGAYITVMVEIKLNGTVGSYIQQLEGNRWMGEYGRKAIGTKGGMVIMWDKWA